MSNLDVIDPTFKDNLKQSDEVAHEVSTRLNQYFAKHHPEYRIHVLPVKTRPHVSQRFQYSDNGDAELIYTPKDGGPCQKKILEFKYRKQQRFLSLREFRFPDMVIDTMFKFEKIRNRKDTLAYIVSDQSNTCIFCALVSDLEQHMITGRQFSKTRQKYYLEVKIEPMYLHEGIPDVCKSLIHAFHNTSPTNPTNPMDIQKNKIRRLIREHTQQIQNIQRIKRKLEQELYELDPTPKVQIQQKIPQKPQKPRKRFKMRK